MDQPLVWGALAALGWVWQQGWLGDQPPRRVPAPACHCTCELEVTAVRPWQAQAGLLGFLVVAVFLVGCACGGVAVHQLSAVRPRTSKFAADRLAVYHR